MMLICICLILAFLLLMCLLVCSLFFAGKDGQLLPSKYNLIASAVLVAISGCPAGQELHDFPY